MDTERTVREIEEALIERAGGWRRNICVPNVTVGSFLLDHEADLIVVNPSGYAHEFEIKRSLADFRKDLDKRHGHWAEWIYRFSYVVPETILKDAISILTARIGDAPFPLPQVLSYDEKLKFSVSGGHAELPPITVGRQKIVHRRMHLEEMLRLARLGTMRYWNLRTNKNKSL